MHITAIIAAGGRGQRFGGAKPKQLLAVGGRPILERSVAAFLSHPAIDAVIVALPAELAADPPGYLRSPESLALRSAGAVVKPLRIVAGGERRRDSVANAFRVADAASDLIVIHDAARPFASADLITRTIAAAIETGAALAAVRARDTVKRGELVVRPVDRRRAQDERTSASLALSSSNGERDLQVAETLPRDTIFLAQTPQAFRRDILRDALQLADDATDEASLVERAGHPVRLVDGEATNIKITTAEDIAIAEAIAETLRIADPGLRTSDLTTDRASAIRNQSATRNPQSAMSPPARTGRAGTGYDLHRLVEGRPLVIGGVVIPSDRGAVGHSDADVVCHAVVDAILGAACLGDIGLHFPDTDPRWKDASSLDLLRRAVAMIAEKGLQVDNVDVTVILERPKIRDHVDAMRASVAQSLGIDVTRVSIKAKTNEGIGAVGRGEAIVAHAVALVRTGSANPQSRIPTP
jgi:2-C-methyl-D-erythritol 4-phosphate cytidylyltransferase/2-C-methyl-D-erythritol 2,4-cyclodiphosphate synthase